MSEWVAITNEEKEARRIAELSMQAYHGALSNEHHGLKSISCSEATRDALLPLAKYSDPPEPDGQPRYPHDSLLGMRLVIDEALDYGEFRVEVNT